MGETCEKDSTRQWFCQTSKEKKRNGENSEVGQHLCFKD